MVLAGIRERIARENKMNVADNLKGASRQRARVKLYLQMGLAHIYCQLRLPFGGLQGQDPLLGHTEQVSTMVKSRTMIVIVVIAIARAMRMTMRKKKAAGATWVRTMTTT